MATEGSNAELTASPVSFIVDKHGNRLEIVDEYARSLIASAGKESYPVGVEYVSTIECNPALMFGGTWTYDESDHRYGGRYVYVRIA